MLPRSSSPARGRWRRRRRRGRTARPPGCLYALGRERRHLKPNAFDIGQHIACSIADHTNPLLRQPAIPHRIALRPIASPVRFAVHLDAELCSRAVEIQHVLTRGILLAEAQPGIGAAQGESQGDFRGRHLTTQRLRLLLSPLRSLEPHLSAPPSLTKSESRSLPPEEVARRCEWLECPPSRNEGHRRPPPPSPSAPPPPCGRG